MLLRDVFPSCAICDCGGEDEGFVVFVCGVSFFAMMSSDLLYDCKLEKKKQKGKSEIRFL